MDRVPFWFKNLLQRRETGGLLIAVATLLVLLFPLPLFIFAVGILSYIFGYELELITGRRYLRWLSPVAFLLSLFSIFLGLLVAFVGALLYGYFEIAKRGYYSHATYQAFATAFLAGVYAGVVPSALVHIKIYNPYLLMAVVFAVWAADTFAYYIGKYFGKTPLVTLISPKKTVEGFIGGLTAGVLIGMMVAAGLGAGFVNPLFWIFVVLTAIVGDLFESFIKRSFGVKDSSQLLGSHGGFLDRFDALLFAAMAAAAFLK